MSGRTKIIMGAGAVVLAWIAWDLYAPRSHSLREFQPDEVGRLETAMWKAYYAHQQVALFEELSTLLRRQYGLPPLRAYVTAYHAARGAVVFQRGQSHADYEKALPEIVAFYRAIRGVSTEAFDVERASRLELDWWIVHRERASHPPEDLDRALAALQGELYHMPAERLNEHARLRAEAMIRRDTGAARGTIDAREWDEIGRLLDGSWRSLWNVVNAR